MIRINGTELLVTDEVLQPGIAEDLRNTLLMMQALTRSLNGEPTALVRATLPATLHPAFDKTVLAFDALPAIDATPVLP